MISFYGHTNTKGKVNHTCFSNFYYAPFVYRGVTLPTSEHALMASKALLFWDLHHYHMIIAADTPASAKSYGRRVQNYSDKIWAAARYEIMVDILVAKFGQNPELLNCLLSTGKETLVEASPTDSIWGVGLGLNDPNLKQVAAWKGTNLLGYALMETRKRLKP